MWTESPSSIQASSCEFASPTATASTPTTWLVPYVQQNRYCALNSALHGAGVGCGKCFRVSFDGVGGTDPGRAGSAIIQAVDSGSAKEFDCFVDVFEEITGARTGVFPVTYTEVDCTESGATAVILDGMNSWYTKVLFAGGPSGVKEASLKVGGTTYPMSRVGGATWSASPRGEENQPVEFHVEYDNGATAVISNCFGGKWPVAISSQCSSA